MVIYKLKRITAHHSIGIKQLKTTKLSKLHLIFSKQILISLYLIFFRNYFEVTIYLVIHRYCHLLISKRWHRLVPTDQNSHEPHHKFLISLKVHQN